MKLNDIDVDSLYLDELKTLQAEYERKLTYWTCLIKSYEAKVERIEPLSEEFEKTMCGLFRAQDSLKGIAVELTHVKYKISTYDFIKK